jgi:hypothetical protein
MSELESALGEVAQRGAAAYLAQHAPQRAQHAQQQAPQLDEGKGQGQEQGEGEGQLEAEGEEEVTDPIWDLDR